MRHHLEVLPPRERRFDRRELASEADLPSHRGWVLFHVEAANPDVPARRRDEGCDGADEGGLSRAVRTEQCEDFPRARHDIETVERRHLAKADREIRCFEEWDLCWAIDPMRHSIKYTISQIDSVDTCSICSSRTSNLGR
jgi:hypothetical protein